MHMDFDHSATVNFFLVGEKKEFAFRRLPFVPREGEICVFADRRYIVQKVEWCLDIGATEKGVRVNIELQPV